LIESIPREKYGFAAQTTHSQVYGHPRPLRRYDQSCTNFRTLLETVLALKDSTTFTSLKDGCVQFGYECHPRLYQK